MRQSMLTDEQARFLREEKETLSEIRLALTEIDVARKLEVSHDLIYAVRGPGQIHPVHTGRVAHERRRSKEQLVDDPEHRRVRADPESKRHHHAKRECWTRSQPSKRIADVLQGRLDHDRTARVAAVVLDAVDSAEREPRPAHRLLARHTLSREFLGLVLDVEAQLVVHLAIEFRAIEKRTETAQEIHGGVARSDERFDGGKSAE